MIFKGAHSKYSKDELTIFRRKIVTKYRTKDTKAELTS